MFVGAMNLPTGIQKSMDLVNKQANFIEKTNRRKNNNNDTDQSIKSRRKASLNKGLYATKPPDYEGISSSLRTQLESSRKTLNKKQVENEKLLRSLSQEDGKKASSRGRMWK